MKSLIAFVVLLYTSSSFSSTVAPSVPNFLWYRSDGIVFVYFNGARTGVVPTCAVAPGEYFKFAINANTVGGRAQLAGLIAAHAAGEPVWVRGTGDCGIFGDAESILDFNTAN